MRVQHLNGRMAPAETGQNEREFNTTEKFDREDDVGNHLAELEKRSQRRRP